MSTQDSLVKSRRWFAVTAMFGVLSLMAACGGGKSSSSSPTASANNTSTPGNNTIASPAANVAALNVINSNLPYVTIQVCKPGTTTCSTIPNVLVDTGSFGLRILNTPLNASSISSLGLPQIASSGGKLAECVTFLSNAFVWGLVQRADVIVGGESTTTHGSGGIPIHVVGDPGDAAGDSSFPAIPSTCGTEANAANSFFNLGANGILGVGSFIQDCPFCETNIPSTPVYYSCSGDSCSGVTVPQANQTANPVAFFADNNGTIIELPAIPDGGQASVTGALVFGIGTQSNNGLGSATVLTQDTRANFTTQFKGQSYPNSFIDSGSNAMFFLDSSTFAIALGGNPMPICIQSGQFINDPEISKFYCGTLSSSATNVGSNGNSIVVPFSIANAETQFLTNNEAFNNVAGPNSGSFDWGMPFFYGRNVYSAISGVTPPSGVPAGPFWAY